MILILKPQADESRVRALAEQLEQRGVAIHYSQGTQESLMGLVGDTTHLDEDWLRANDIVAECRQIVDNMESPAES